MKNGVGKFARLRGIAQVSENARQPHTARVSSGKRLNAEAGDQRVERRDGVGTSSGPEWHEVLGFKDRGGKCIERCRRDQRLNLVISAVLQQPQSTLADLSARGIWSRESSSHAVSRGMIAQCATTVRHAMHFAATGHYPHVLTAHLAKRRRHLPGDEQK